MFDMTQNYCVIESNIPQYKAMVVGLSPESVTDYFDEISRFLSSKQINGKILLDYYSYNRSNKRRFCEINFDGEKFPINTIKKITISNYMKDTLNILYKKINIPEVLFIK